VTGHHKIRKEKAIADAMAFFFPVSRLPGYHKDPLAG
jgi:hypothetical protein